jgi:hypothetical protein
MTIDPAVVERQYYLNLLNWTIDDTTYSLSELREAYYGKVDQKRIDPKIRDTINALIAEQAMVDSSTYGRKDIWVNVKDHGALGDRRVDAAGPGSNDPTAGGTDNTAAFNAALAVLVAIVDRDSGRWWEANVTAKPTLYIPAGRYNIGDLTAINVPGLRIVGAGKGATVLYHIGTVAAFTFGVFTTTPANPWQGIAQNISIEHLTIVQANEWNGGGYGFGTEGSRTRTAIVDNFGGGFYLNCVAVVGFQYGFLANGSSDFTQILDSAFSYCDVGVFLGPQTAQIRLSGVSFAICRESLVLAGVIQGSIQNCWFMDATKSHIVIEDNAVTRTGVVLVSPDYHVIEIANCWFEDYAGGSRICNEHVKISSDNSGVPRWIHLRDNYVVAGGSHAGKRAFVRMSTRAVYVLIERTSVYGFLDWMVEQLAGSYSVVMQRDSTTVDGYTKVPHWGTSAGSAVTGWSGANYTDTFDFTFTTAARPSAVDWGQGMSYFDTTLNKPIWSNGSVWKDAAGTTV